MPHVIRPRGARRALSTLLGVAAIATLGVPATASAACPVAPTSKPFAAFGDLADYSLVPNGGLESGATGWTLSKASVAAGNESFFVRSVSDTRSLSLQPGGKATTASFCVGAEHPTFRFFARQPHGAGSPDMKVYIRYLTQDGVWKDQQVDTYAGDGYALWKPSRVIDLYAKLGFSDATATTTARLVFEAENETGSAWRLDDVYVDPYKR